MNRSAILFSIDALIAATIFTIVVASMTLQMTDNDLPKYNQRDLSDTGGDVLTMLKANGKLEKAAVTGEGEELVRILNRIMPYNACAIITLYSGDGNNLLEIPKENCELQPAKDSIIAVVPFVKERQLHIAEIRLWYT
jgi:hypothetical protein